MRILYVVTGAGFGGAPAHVLRLMEADVKDGHAVGIVTSPEPRTISEAKRLDACIFPAPYFVRPIQLHNDIRALWLVLQAIRRFNPDLVSAHSTKAGYAARLACAILRKRVVFTAHGWAFGGGRGRFKSGLVVTMERLAAKATARIICVSDHDRDLALQHRIAQPDKLVVIHNGVDPQPFLNANSMLVRREFNLGQSTVITMVARLVPQKDPLTLLRACQFLKGSFVLLVVGEGELRSQMEHFVSNSGLEHSTILTGERKDVPEILAASDIFVLSSLWEGLPYTIIEAMIAGLPVVATRVGGIPELVEDNVTGFLVPPGGPKTLAKALQNLLDNSNVRHEMGRAGRARALREFNLDDMLRKTRQVYDQVLKSR